MNSEEARFILAAIRPGDESADAPPEVAEALALLERDPELQAWYEQQLAFDEAIGERLNAVEPPAELRAAILTGMRVSRPLPWWRRRAFVSLAAAAVVSLLALAGAKLFAPGGTDSQDVDGFRRAMLAELGRLRKLELESSDLVEIGAWLAAAEAPSLAPDGLPAFDEATLPLGCKLVDWNGHRASLVCFETPGGVCHLVVIDASAFDSLDDSAGAGAELLAEGDWRTATWRQDGKVVMLATREVEELQPLLPSTA